jgi:hypothetical protein
VSNQKGVAEPSKTGESGARVGDITRAGGNGVLTDAETGTLHDMFEYYKWDEDQIARGARVRAALEGAAAVLLADVPPCPDRAAALRKLREARMDANSAITHRGRY